MIQYLHIKNIALVDEVEIEFFRGLNCITGETGAGKSVIVGSLNFILGERSDVSQIRSGHDKALIEAIFDISLNAPLKKYLNEIGVTFEEKEFLIKRELAREGKGRCFVCGSIVTQGMLKTIGDLLVDMHGQHDHQSLLNSACHTTIVDSFGRLEEHCSKVSKAYRQYKETIDTRDGFRSSVEERNRDYEYLVFQINEIAAAQVEVGEDEALLKEHELLNNAVHIKGLTESMYGELYEADESVVGKINAFEKSLSELAKYDEQFLGYQNNLSEISCVLRDLAETLTQFNTTIDVSGDRLSEVEERLSLVERLKKKYGMSVDELINFKEELDQKIRCVENYDEELDRLEKDVKERASELHKLCGQLSKKRKQSASKLSLLVEKELSQLGIVNAQFEVRSIAIECGVTGAEKLEFFISANKGEKCKPLKSVASGGEISRIMLAIKKAIAEVDSIQVMVFDEIDVNVGGQLASRVGDRMKEISKEKQVLCITHLPQIARHAQNHLCVEKKVINGKTHTFVKTLSPEERMGEITRMLGSTDAASAASEYAKVLLTKK